MSIRRLFLTVAFVALPWLCTFEPTGISGAPLVAVAAPEEVPNAPKVPDVDVDINRSERHVISFENPVVLAVGAGALILIIALIAMASRGGGTTIVKER